MMEQVIALPDRFEFLIDSKKNARVSWYVYLDKEDSQLPLVGTPVLITQIDTEENLFDGKVTYLESVKDDGRYIKVVAKGVQP